MTFLTICSQANVTVTYLFSWPHNTPGHSHYTCHTVQNVRPGPSPLCAPVYMVSPAEKVSRDARHTRRQSTKGHFSQTLPCTPSVQTYRHSGWLVFGCSYRYGLEPCLLFLYCLIMIFFLNPNILYAIRKLKIVQRPTAIFVSSLLTFLLVPLCLCFVELFMNSEWS